MPILRLSVLNGRSHLRPCPSQIPRGKDRVGKYCNLLHRLQQEEGGTYPFRGLHEAYPQTDPSRMDPGPQNYHRVSSSAKELAGLPILEYRACRINSQNITTLLSYSCGYLFGGLLDIIHIAWLDFPACHGQLGAFAGPGDQVKMIMHHHLIHPPAI